jgi:MFS family permease
MKADVGARTMRKVVWRLVPFLAVLYMFNIIDRANVSFARLAMTSDLGLSDAVIDLGFGLFFVGYLLFEVPSNLLLRRFGARKWISRIMISWGIVSMLTAWVTGATSYYWARILLGVAEAGFFPGIIFYLTAWFPVSLRARVVAWFMLAIPLANIIGNPISGAIMDTMKGVGGLAGWQWLFVLEGIPSVLLGCSVLWLLPDRPADAAWLDADEQEWLQAELGREAGGRREAGGSEKLSALADPRVWLLIGLYASVAVGTNATGAYLPKLVKGHFEPLLMAGQEGAGGAPGSLFWKIGLLSALPHLASVAAMVLMSRLSDLWRMRALPAAVALSAAAAGWLLAWQAGNPWLALLGLCLAQAGMMAVLPVFWALPPLFLGGAAAAAGIALINSVANIGGIFAPSVIGRFGVGPMVGVMAWGVAMAFVAWWFVERRGRRSSPA